MEMIDIGEKMSEATCGPCNPEKEDKDKKYYPSLNLSTKQLPDLKGKEPGDRGIMQVEYEIKGYSMRSTKDKKDDGNYDLEIKKIGLSNEEVKSVKEEKADEELKTTTKERLRAGREY